MFIQRILYGKEIIQLLKKKTIIINKLCRQSDSLYKYNAYNCNYYDL